MKEINQIIAALMLFVLSIVSTGFDRKSENVSYITTGQTDDLTNSMVRGKELYLMNCVSCHMKTGVGIKNVFPPLAKSDYLMADVPRSIKQILYGAEGEITVNGQSYNGVMTSFDLKDQEVADILNYIRNSWGNEGRIVKDSEVKKVRG